ncbi:MAG: DUF433 domain-containing protein [Hormoscilla sp. GM7CHS1pb]|nr:DUF433 domain-containing protein [Hormoscilla sp. GM7CHS1pb]
MQLEDYFEFLGPDDIRIEGTRVGIETVLDEYLYNGKSPEAIASMYSTLNLELVYATILYYLHDKETVSRYLDNWIEYARKAQEEYDKNPPPFVKRLLKIKAERNRQLVQNNDN